MFFSFHRPNHFECTITTGGNFSKAQFNEKDRRVKIVEAFLVQPTPQHSSLFLQARFFLLDCNLGKSQTGLQNLCMCPLCRILSAAALFRAIFTLGTAGET
jgi:hypothetical protein